MSRRFLISILVAVLSVSFCVALQSEATGFVGRWEIQIGAPSGPPATMAIVEFALKDGALNGKVVTFASAAFTPTLEGVSTEGGRLSFSLNLGQILTFTAKRVGDHLEGHVAPPIDRDWTGSQTTKDKIEPPVQTEEQKAFNAAMQTQDPKQRQAAFEKYIKDYPSGTNYDSALYQLALLPPDVKDRKASLEKFIQENPNNRFQEQAYLRIANDTRDLAERRTLYEKFLKDFPKSTLKAQAELSILNTILDPAEKLAAQETFIKNNPSSPMVTSVFTQMMESIIRKKPLDEAKLLGVIDSYITSVPDLDANVGGRTMNRRLDAYNTVADRLMKNDVLLDKAQELIQKAVDKTTDKTAPQSRGTYLTTLGQVQYKLKDLDQAEQNLKKSIELRGKETSGEATLYLGKVYEGRGDNDSALRTYLDASAVSNTSETRASLERSYSKKYGSLEGLHEKIDAVISSRPKTFEAGHFERGKNVNQDKIVLAELFTGSECGPCVASDLAFDGLIERYDRNTVAVLEYHLHIPGPDPMTNSETEKRAKYYQVNGTPTMVVDGNDKSVGGGGADRAGLIFNQSKGKIEARLAQNPPLKFSGLSVKPQGDSVLVSGQIQGATEGIKDLEKLRLRLVLAEEVLHYTGSNGIHFHHLVVRKFLGTPDGLSLAGEALRKPFSESVALPELQQILKAYLEDYEKNGPRAASNFKWTEKMNQINARQLVLVAFIQNDDTKEVLQSAFVK